MLRRKFYVRVNTENLILYRVAKVLVFLRNETCQYLENKTYN